MDSPWVREAVEAVPRDRVRVITGDAELPEAEAFDRVISTYAVEQVPWAWEEHGAPGMYDLGLHITPDTHYVFTGDDPHAPAGTRSPMPLSAARRTQQTGGSSGAVTGRL
ncbi:hypothetical protein [Streptomyces sp. NPDC101178]|uniref:hypothetical protein n=1 Tax=Streptomyces sp. NPDC101178 TaxID=3366124 RepID=UPI00380A817E